MSNLLILDHGHGLSSSFLHLSGFTVAVGKEVKQGDGTWQAPKGFRAARQRDLRGMHLV